MVTREELFATLPMFGSLVMDVYIIHIVEIASMPILVKYGNLIIRSDKKWLSIVAIL
jgi:hypothetical protein